MSVTTTATGTREDDGPWDGYAPESERPPLGTYLALASGWASAATALLVVGRRRNSLPERMEPQDIVLFGAAAFKLSRLVTKAKITAFARAPFTEYQGKGTAPGEVDERPRARRGPRAAVGQLLTCPYCMGLWIASALTVGYVTAPRETRLVAGAISAVGVSDFFQAAYCELADRDEAG